MGDFCGLPKVASYLMLTERRVNQLAKENILPKISRGEYDLEKCVQSYIAWIQEKHSSDFQAEKTRKTRHEADLVEMESKKRSGELVEASEIEKVWAMLLAELKVNLLENLPARITQSTIGMDDEVKIKHLVKLEIEQALIKTSKMEIHEDEDIEEYEENT